MILNINEYIDDLVLDGFTREDAIVMAKEEIAKRKKVVVTVVTRGVVSDNNYQMNKSQATLMDTRGLRKEDQ